MGTESNSSERGDFNAGWSRRSFVTGVLSGGALVAGGEVARSAWSDAGGQTSADIVDVHGPVQAGIVTKQQRHLTFLALDIEDVGPSDVRALLASWAASARALMQGRQLLASDNSAPADTGETLGLRPARLTVTFGLGTGAFDRDGEDRFGLRAQAPDQLRTLPSFSADALEERFSDGDLGVQICANDPMVVRHAAHTLVRQAHGVAKPRWSQSGFISLDAGTPRNTLGFRDGSRNLKSSDPTARRQLWVQRGDTHPWMTGGTYVLVRRIRTLLDVWDATSLGGQETAIGRRKDTGAPIGGRDESDEPDVSNGSAIPPTAHVRLAAPENNGGSQILRRSFNYDAGIDRTTGQEDVGLIFICFQRDPHRQFARIQRSLDQRDALAQHLVHTGSALFACPPGFGPRGFPGEGLFRS